MLWRTCKRADWPGGAITTKNMSGLNPEEASFHLMYKIPGQWGRLIQDPADGGSATVSTQPPVSWG